MTLHPLCIGSTKHSVIDNTTQAIIKHPHVIMEWTTSLDTSSRTLFVRMWGCVSTSRRTSSCVITSECY